MVDLVHYDIKIINIGQRIHLNLVAPNPILRHILTVLLNRLIILNKELIHLLVFEDVLHGPLSVNLVLAFVALELVGYGPEEAVAITLHFFDLQTQWLQLLHKLIHINPILLQIKLVLFPLPLPLTEPLHLLLHLLLLVLALPLLLLFLLRLLLFVVFSWHF